MNSRFVKVADASYGHYDADAKGIKDYVRADRPVD